MAKSSESRKGVQILCEGWGKVSYPKLHWLGNPSLPGVDFLPPYSSQSLRQHVLSILSSTFQLSIWVTLWHLHRWSHEWNLCLGESEDVTPIEIILKQWEVSISTYTNYSIYSFWHLWTSTLTRHTKMCVQRQMTTHLGHPSDKRMDQTSAHPYLCEKKKCGSHYPTGIDVVVNSSPKKSSSPQGLTFFFAKARAG